MYIQNIYLANGRDMVGDFTDCEVPANSVSEARQKLENSIGILEWEFQRTSEGKVKLKGGGCEVDPLYED